MNRKMIVLCVGVLAAVSMWAYAAVTSTITVKGSDTMVILAQRWAEEYMAQHADVSIQVTGGGSGTGFSALINGTTDICNSSRPITANERGKLKQKFKSTGVEIKVAKDGVSLFVNSSNPVTELTLDQIKAIYTGTITNWKQVGGANAKIIVYGRENSSGTYVYFRDDVLLGQDYVPTMQTMPGTAAVVNALTHDVNGIGFGGAAYGKGIKFIKVKKDAQTPGYAPDIKSIKSGEYPITRYLYLYLRSLPVGSQKQFIDWILCDKGQAVVAETGYFPIR